MLKNTGMLIVKSKANSEKYTELKLYMGMILKPFKLSYVHG